MGLMATMAWLRVSETDWVRLRAGLAELALGAAKERVAHARAATREMERKENIMLFKGMWVSV
jgi:hypothetical protein